MRSLQTRVVNRRRILLLSLFSSIRAHCKVRKTQLRCFLFLFSSCYLLWEASSIWVPLGISSLVQPGFIPSWFRTGTRFQLVFQIQVGFSLCERGWGTTMINVPDSVALHVRVNNYRIHFSKRMHRCLFVFPSLSKRISRSPVDCVYIFVYNCHVIIFPTSVFCGGTIYFFVPCLNTKVRAFAIGGNAPKPVRKDFE